MLRRTPRKPPSVMTHRKPRALAQAIPWSFTSYRQQIKSPPRWVEYYCSCEYRCRSGLKIWYTALFSPPAARPRAWQYPWFQLHHARRRCWRDMLFICMRFLTPLQMRAITQRAAKCQNMKTALPDATRRRAIARRGAMSMIIVLRGRCNLRSHARLMF